jgi:hypothetical protein
MFNLRTFGLTATLLTAVTPAAWAQPNIVSPDLPEVRTELLARFQLADGNEIRFLGVPEMDEVMVGEITDAGPNERFFIRPNTPPAEVFKLLAPEDAPVPRAIASTDDKGLLAGRAVVDALDETIEVPMSKIGVQPSGPRKAGAGSCQTGAAGAMYFETHHCGSLGGPGYGSSEASCLKDATNYKPNQTSSRRRTTWTVMASCGGGMNRLIHYYGTASGWTNQLNVYVDPQKIVSFWSYTKGVKRHRKVIFQDHQDAGWVRGWVKYHSEVAGGW